MIVISNSSPLINFDALGRLDILQTLYGSLFIPEAVYHEIVMAGRHYPSAAEIKQAEWIIPKPVANRAPSRLSTIWAEGRQKPSCWP